MFVMMVEVGSVKRIGKQDPRDSGVRLIVARKVLFFAFLTRFFRQVTE